MTLRRAIAVASAGVVVGIAAERYSIRAHAPENHWLDLAVGWTYLATGIIASVRRPDNRTGLLMTAFGFAWFVGNFGTSGRPVLVSVGTAFDGLNGAILAHLVLAYPSGRLQRVSERVVIGALYCWLVIYGIVVALTFDPPTVFGCVLCPEGGLAAFPSRSAYLDIRHAGDIAVAVFATAAILLLVRRFVSASPVARRQLAPLWFAASLVGIVFVIEGITGNHDANAVQKLLQMLVPLVFLAGLLRSRLAEAAVGGLLLALDKPLRRGELRELLAKALGDPDLRLAFVVPDGELVSEDGTTAKVESDDRTVATYVSDEGVPIAALIHDRALLERRPLLDAVCAAARLALENERLHAEVRAQLEEVKASRTRIVEAAEAERRRVERNLHDGAQQRLVTLSLELALARERAAAGGDEALTAALDEAATEVADAIAELRELARGLHPAILTEAGLGPALGSLAERSPVPTLVHTTLNGRLPAAIEAGAYFAASEALANVGKHARATHADVTAAVVDGRLRLAIEDDGVGGAAAAAGSGLAALADRIAALDGRLHIDSPSGSGTRIEVELPCA